MMASGPGFRESGRRWRRSPGWLPHEAILLTPFSRIETIAVPERRQKPVEHLIDRALSRSGSPAAAIGERMAADLRKMLAPLAVEGMVGEVIQSTAPIAWPPAVR
jgi:hypothetical protein